MHTREDEHIPVCPICRASSLPSSVYCERCVRVEQVLVLTESPSLSAEEYAALKHKLSGCSGIQETLTLGEIVLEPEATPPEFIRRQANPSWVALAAPRPAAQALARRKL